MDIQTLRWSKDREERWKGFYGGIANPYKRIIQLWMKSLKDRVADRNSFFMPGADLVQIEHHSMEIMDTVDNQASIL